MIKIVSDTTTGLTREMAAPYGIDIVSQIVNFGSETLRDGIDITNEVFLQRLKTSKEFPTTSQPPAGDFVEVFRPHLDAGHEVLCITVSSGLSGTYSSAVTAREQLGTDRVTVVDSRTVAAAETLIVWEAARLVKEGKAMADIVARLDQWIAGMRLDFVLNTIEYLVKGGRASSLQGLLGTLLQMKPIFTIRNGTGKIDVLARVRTRAKALAHLREVIDGGVDGKSRVHMAVVHTGAPDEAARMAEELRQKYALDNCPALEMPPAVAAHAGPGALGAAYFVEA
jgi:DegV family protein with EDD domain